MFLKKAIVRCEDVCWVIIMGYKLRINKQRVEYKTTQKTINNRDYLQNLGEKLSRMRRSPSEATVERFHVYSKVTSRYSRVKITSDVRNDATTAQEVSIELRLPKTAFISNFSM